jgi:hypothetical protein
VKLHPTDSDCTGSHAGVYPAHMCSRPMGPHQNSAQPYTSLPFSVTHSAVSLFQNFIPRVPRSSVTIVVLRGERVFRFIGIFARVLSCTSQRKLFSGAEYWFLKRSNKDRGFLVPRCQVGFRSWVPNRLCFLHFIFFLSALMFHAHLFYKWIGGFCTISV